MDYEGQICRTPMEGSAFGLPVMVGCSYNACKFCGLFKHLKWRVLPLEQVEAECARVKGLGGAPKKIFLGDGNAFDLDSGHLLEIIRLVRGYFPDVEAFNMDATVTSILQKTDDELRALYAAGVRHLYLGIESGLDDVLRFMNKEHTLAQAYQAVERLQAAGLIFDAHVMTGVAGAGRSEEAAHALAEFFNRTHPTHVCNFSLFVEESLPLGQELLRGRFHAASELDNLKEDRLFVSLLRPDAAHPLTYDSFHDFLGLRVRGTLPADREKMLARLDQFIAEEEKEEQPRYSFLPKDAHPTFDDRTGRYHWDSSIPAV